MAAFIGAQPEEIIFTSGATESSNLALMGFAARSKRSGDHVIISEVEHISLHNIGKNLEKNGFRVSKVPPDQYGRINPEKLRARITDETILVSVGWASNEIGTIQPIQPSPRCYGGPAWRMHVDAVAAEGLLPIDMATVPVDLLTLSSNDIYGPPGLGALYVRKGTRLAAITMGGGQERGLRSGTENLPAIVGMAAAAQDRRRGAAHGGSPPRSDARPADQRRTLRPFPTPTSTDIRSSAYPTTRTSASTASKGSRCSCLLKDEGIAVSTGSACSSKTLEPSHTLISCGLVHQEAHGSLELTFGRFSREADVDRLMEVLPGIVARLRRMSPLYEEH